MIKRYFARTSLFTIMAMLCAIASVIVAIGRQPPGVKRALLLRLLCATMVLVATDVLLKQVCKLRNWLLWSLQLLLLLIAIYLWVISE